jgi:hypothetical protein
LFQDVFVGAGKWFRQVDILTRRSGEATREENGPAGEAEAVLAMKKRAEMS